MKLAKPRIDIGLRTNNVQPLLDFWQKEIGLPFDHLLPVRKGQNQHRHDLLGSVLKINEFAEPIPDRPPSGYHELLIARDGLSDAKSLADPEGNRVTLVPKGTHGIERIGIRLAVRDVAAHRRFYAEALGLAEGPTAGGAATFLAGDTVLLLEQSPDAPSDSGMEGKGLALHHVPGVRGGPRTCACAGAWRARGPCAGDARHHRAHLDGARPRRQLDRAVATRVDHGVAGD